MKNVMKRSFAVLMTLVMCASMFFGLTFSAQAAETPTVNYVYDGSYVYNWGERGTKAEFLSPMAIEFYSANGTTLDGLLALDGSASESGVPSSALFGELHELMESNHDYITSYNATKNLFQYTDCQNSGGKISSFYSGTAIGPSWDGAWNREHVWPNSKGDEAGNGENDLMMLRPTSTSENSSRGNKAYGTATTTSYYNPNDEGGGAYDLRGDVARIILYQYVRWECTNTGSSYNSSSIFGSDGVIESQDVLLDWIEADPVDTWEMGRNDAAESILGTRNVFVDYPELAFDLFNEAVPTDYTSPSGGTSVEGDTSGGSTGNDTTEDDVTVATTATITFDSTDKRTTFNTSQQIWTENDIVVTNNKSSSTTNVADYANPARFYKSSELIIEYPSNITKIEFTANSSTYATALQSSISGSSANGSVVTVELDTPAKSFTAILSGGQVRMNSITVYAEAASNDNTTDDKVYVDSNGVIVSGSADAFPEDTTITVTPITSGDAFDTATSALDGIASKFTAYDVTPSATLNEGAVVTLTLPLPDGYDADNTRVVHIPEDGVIDLENDVLYPSVDKVAKTVSVEVTHFSTYAVVDTSEASSEGGSTEAEEVTATIDFTTTTQRVSQTTAKQVWANDGLTFINDKASSTTNVADYSNPVRIYANSSVEIKYDGGKIKKIVIDGTSSSVSNAQITAWKTSIDNLGDSNISTSLSSKVVTVEFATEVDSLVITSLSAQARAMYITATVLKTSTGGDSTSPKITATANNKSYGTVEVSDKYITATPATGYEVSGYEIVSGNTNATVTQSGNNFTVETDADVTIQINFVARTQYTVTFSEQGTITSTQNAYSGDSIMLPEHTAENTPDGYEFIGWATVENATADIKAAGSTYSVNSAVTFYAQYSEISDQPTTQATITFDDTSKRVVGTTSQQKWVENGVTVTNDKAESTSNVNTSYYNPIRVYASSSLTIEYPGMTKIEITANNASYATVVAKSISDSNATVTTNEKVVTITLATAVDSFVISKLSTQTRLDSITIYATESAEPSNQYTVTYIENGKETASTTLAEGTVITLPNDTATPSDKNFVGWATVENATSDSLSAGASHTVNSDVTFYAQYTDKIVETATHDFVKVTEDQTDWTGTYLIVYEKDSVAFNGSLTSLKTANGLDVSIVDSKIKATDSALAASFTIEAIEGGYAIKSSSGYYIGRTSANTDSNDLLFNQSTQYVNSISLSDGNVNVVSGNTYLRWNASSSFFRYYKSGTYTDQQPIALYKLDVADISGAQVTVGADLTMKYYVDVTNIENVNSGDLTMRFSIDGEVIDTVSGTVVGSQYVFDFAGLAPQRMADIIKAELLLNGGVIDVKDNYSIKQNAINLLADNPSDELVQFITDMLYYGAAAQTYTKYNTDNLATSGVTDLGTPSTATPVGDDAMSLTVEDGVTIDNVYFRAASVWFDTENGIIVKLNDATNATLKVNGVEVTLDGLQYMISGIKATEFDTIYTFELYEDDVKIQTLTYSINAYAYSKQNSSNTNMANLALSLYRFGKSADAYNATL